MIIVVEGTRKSGKTTFIDQLEKYCEGSNIKMFRFYDRHLQSLKGVSQKDANYVSCLQLLNASDMIEKTEPNALIVFDRFHISELIFGNRYRQYYSYEMYDIDRKLAGRNSALITFVSNTCERRMKRGENPFKSDFVSEHFYSFIKSKSLISLDDKSGVVNNETVEEILRSIGYVKENVADSL